MESALPSKKVVVSKVRRVPGNTSALGAGAHEVTMSANACSPGWLRSLEHFLPSCDDDPVSLSPLLLLSVKSSNTRVCVLPVVACDDQETDYRGDHRSDEPQLDFFFGSISVIFRRIRQTILFTVCWSTRAP